MGQLWRHALTSAPVGRRPLAAATKGPEAARMCMDSMVQIAAGQPLQSNIPRLAASQRISVAPCVYCGYQRAEGAAWDDSAAHGRRACTGHQRNDGYDPCCEVTLRRGGRVEVPSDIGVTGSRFSGPTSRRGLSCSATSDGKALSARSNTGCWLPRRRELVLQGVKDHGVTARMDAAYSMRLCPAKLCPSKGTLLSITRSATHS